MARALTPQDGYAIITEIARQATGQNSFATVDASNFVSAGETVLATGMENTYNAINMVLGRLVLATRPYQGKFLTVQAADSGVYSHRFRKISYYSKDALPTGWFNTNLYTNHAEGYTAGDNGGASVKSQWEQHQAMPLEMNFAGSTPWDDCITEYEDAVKQAFRSVDDFNAFVTGYLTEHANDIEQQKEAFNRMTVLSKIASIYDYATNEGVVTEAAVNMTTEFNNWFGTSHLTQDLLTTYLKDFNEFFIATLKRYSDALTDRSALYHNPMTKTVGGINYSVLRHTPKEDQRLILNADILRLSEAMVMPEVFGPNYLELGQNYETVNYWQVNDGTTNRFKVDFQTAIYDGVTGVQKQGARVQLDMVLGLLFDRDSILTDFQLETTRTTGLEARKGYRNTWLHVAKNAINDPTENAILFYMAD